MLRSSTTVSLLIAASISALAGNVLAQGWIVSGYTGTGGLNRGVFDYTQGSGTLTNFRFTQYNSTTNDWGIAGIENVNGTTYLLTTFNQNRLNKVTYSGSTMQLTALTAPGALGNSAEGDLGYNAADGYFYSIGNTPFTSTKSIYRIDANNWSTTMIGTFQADDPSGLAFDNAGNCFILDTHGNSGGIAELLRFDVMSNPGMAAYKGKSSLGIGTGPACGMDVNQSINQLCVMTISGAMYAINNPLTTPTPQLLDFAVGSNNVTGLAWVPSPGSLALLAAAGVLTARRRR